MSCVKRNLENSSVDAHTGIWTDNNYLGAACRQRTKNRHFFFFAFAAITSVITNLLAAAVCDVSCGQGSGQILDEIIPVPVGLVRADRFSSMR